MLHGTEMLLPHRVYLNGELGKLADVSHARHFASAIEVGVLAATGLNDEAEALAGRFANQATVEEFVGSLHRDDAIRLSDAVSRWRGNSVWRKTAGGAD